MRITINIDVTKIPKDKIIPRTFELKDGTEVTVKELKLDIVELNAPKFIKEGETWRMMKTHFVALPQTKEEREAGEKSTIIGDGITFENKEATISKKETVDSEEISSDDIPL